MIPDSPDARSPDTAMRDLLRRLERLTTYQQPARPTALPPFAAAPATVRVGDWVLSADPDTGDLVATDPDGTTTVLITRTPGDA